MSKTLFFHGRQCQSGGVKEAGDIGIEHFLPLIEANFFAKAKITQSGVVDEDINFSMCGEDFIESGLKGFVISNIRDKAMVIIVFSGAAGSAKSINGGAFC